MLSVFVKYDKKCCPSGFFEKKLDKLTKSRV